MVPTKEKRMERACSHNSNYLMWVAPHSGLQDGAVSPRQNDRSQALLILLLLTEHSVPRGSLHRYPQRGRKPKISALGWAGSWMNWPRFCGTEAGALIPVPEYWSFKDPWVCLKPQSMQISYMYLYAFIWGIQSFLWLFNETQCLFFFLFKTNKTGLEGKAFIKIFVHFLRTLGKCN